MIIIEIMFGALSWSAGCFALGFLIGRRHKPKGST